MSGARWIVGGVLALSLMSFGAARAQDIEAAARARGVVLPKGYWDRIADDPTAFTLPNGMFPAMASIRIPRPAVIGTTRLPVVLALFADSPVPAFTPDDVRQTLFTGPAPHGTVTDFFREASGGRFVLEGDVFPWVRTSLPMATVVGTSFGLGGDAQVGPYLIEALASNDPAIDFSLYDNDGPDGIPNSGDDDGTVDAVTFEFLEVAASCGGPAIWPHRWSMSGRTGQPFTTDDAASAGGFILVDSYIIQGVTDCSGQNVQIAGTIAHEFGHVLGLPDYYHPIGPITPENRRWVLGCWALMAAGSWGCGPVGSTTSPFGPTHFVSWSKHWLGWLDYIDVGPVHDEEFALPPVRTSGRALRIPLDDQGLEFLLVEYRDRRSFDDDTPAEGVLVVHQDFVGEVRPASGLRYFLRMDEADGAGDLLRTSFEAGNRGEASDAFGRPGEPAGRMHNLTQPSTRRNTGEASTVTLHSIQVVNGQARIRVSTAPDPRVQVPSGGVTTGLLSPFEARLRVAGGALPYSATVEPPTPSGVALSIEEDALVLSGEPAEQGATNLLVRVVDALGTAVESLIELTVGPFSVSEERLVGPLVRSGAVPLTTAERTYLDNQGNGNGLYDVGDVRAWLTAGAGS